VKLHGDDPLDLRPAQTIDLRQFTGAIVDDLGVVTDPVTAIYVFGCLDRIEWEHTTREGKIERHVVPVGHVARLYAIEE